MLQEKLKEAQQREQEMNAKLQQYCDDLEAAKVVYCITVHVCCV